MVSCIMASVDVSMLAVASSSNNIWDNLNKKLQMRKFYICRLAHIIFKGILTYIFVNCKTKPVTVS